MQRKLDLKIALFASLLTCTTNCPDKTVLKAAITPRSQCMHAQPLPRQQAQMTGNTSFLVTHLHTAAYGLNPAPTTIRYQRSPDLGTDSNTQIKNTVPSTVLPWEGEGGEKNPLKGGGLFEARADPGYCEAPQTYQHNWERSTGSGVSDEEQSGRGRSQVWNPGLPPRQRTEARIKILGPQSYIVAAQAKIQVKITPSPYFLVFLVRLVSI